MNTTLARIPALTIRRPWSNLIAALIKTRENRGWTTSYRGPVILHSGKVFESGVLGDLIERGVDVPDSYPTGYLGVFQLPAVHTDAECIPECSFWCHPDQKHWEITDVRTFPKHIPGPGKQGLFTPPDHVQDAARALLAVAA